MNIADKLSTAIENQILIGQKVNNLETGVTTLETDIANINSAFNAKGVDTAGVPSTEYEALLDEVKNQGVEVGKQQQYDEFWDSFQQNGNRMDYKYAFSGRAWHKDIIIPKYPIKITGDGLYGQYATGMFIYCCPNGIYAYDASELLSKIDFSEATYLSSTFNSSNFDNIDVDFSSAYNAQNCFNMGDSGYARVTTISLKVTENLTNSTQMFWYCQNLKNLTFKEGSVIACNMNIQHSPLTLESARSVINALKDITGQSITRTLTLSTATKGYLTETDIATITQKGWTLA